MTGGTPVPPFRHALPGRHVYTIRALRCAEEEAPKYDAGQGWLGAANIIMGHLDEFRSQVEKRTTGKGAGPVR